MGLGTEVLLPKSKIGFGEIGEDIEKRGQRESPIFVIFLEMFEKVASRGGGDLRPIPPNKRFLHAVLAKTNYACGQAESS